MRRNAQHSLSGLSGLGSMVDSWDWTGGPNYSLDYQTSFETIAPGIVDYAKMIQSAGMSLIQAVSQARNSLAMSDAQRALLDVQIQRAQAGLPPINTAQYTSGGSPLNQQISTQTVLLIGGALLLWALTRKG